MEALKSYYGQSLSQDLLLECFENVYVENRSRGAIISVVQMQKKFFFFHLKHRFLNV